MEPEVHFLEKYFQEMEHCFTMTNIRCKGRREIDLLAINPVNGKKFHVESRVATSPSFFLTYQDTHTSKGRPQKKGLNYFDKEKFNHPAVKEKIKELFGDAKYHKILVVWAVAETDAMGMSFRSYAFHKYGIVIFQFIELINILMEKGTMRGSRDDILRMIELMSLVNRETKEALEKEIRRMKRAKIVEG